MSDDDVVVEVNPVRFLLAQIEEFEQREGVFVERLRQQAGESGVYLYHSRILATLSHVSDMVEATNGSHIYSRLLQRVWEFFVYPNQQWNSVKPAPFDTDSKNFLESLARNLDSSPLLPARLEPEQIRTLIESLKEMEGLLATEEGIPEDLRGELQRFITRCLNILGANRVNVWELSLVGNSLLGTSCSLANSGKASKDFGKKITSFGKSFIATLWTGVVSGASEAIGTTVAGLLTE